MQHHATKRQKHQPKPGWMQWELEADIMPIDGLIGFAESDMGAQVFGADKAKDVAAHAREIKAAGAKYCDCPACAAVEAILEKKDAILK